MPKINLSVISKAKDVLFAARADALLNIAMLFPQHAMCALVKNTNPQAINADGMPRGLFDNGDKVTVALVTTDKTMETMNDTNVDAGTMLPFLIDVDLEFGTLTVMSHNREQLTRRLMVESSYDMSDLGQYLKVSCVPMAYADVR